MDPHARLRSQIRAGRELLNMNQGDIASSLGMSLSKISRSESGETKSGDTLLEIKQGLERMGVRFTQSGVEIVEDHIEVLEGEGCYLRLMDDIYNRLKNAEDKEFLVMFAVEKISPPELDMRYQLMRQQGITYRKIISEEDSYIKGPLEKYRTMPAQYFSNVITIVYGNRVAQASGSGSRITIHEDAPFAERERQIFSYLWNTGKQPVTTSAREKYE